jgi:hypothetical protein
MIVKYSVKQFCHCLAHVHTSAAQRAAARVQGGTTQATLASSIAGSIRPASSDKPSNMEYFFFLT